MINQKSQGPQLRIIFRKIPGLEGEEYYLLQSLEERLIDAAIAILEKRNSTIGLDEIAFTDQYYVRLTAQEVYHSAYSLLRYSGSDMILTLRSVIGGDNLAHPPEKKNEFHKIETFVKELADPQVTSKPQNQNPKK